MIGYQTKIVDSLIEAIVTSTEKSDWNKQLKACVKNIENIEKLKPLESVLKISAEHELDDYAAAILHHSRKNSLTK